MCGKNSSKTAGFYFFATSRYLKRELLFSDDTINNLQTPLSPLKKFREIENPPSHAYV